MKNEKLRDFFLGLLISFTISVLIVTLVYTLAINHSPIPVLLIWQAFGLSVLCSLINLVYRMEKLTFLWQSIIGYVLTTSAILICSLLFDWYGAEGRNFKKTLALFISFLIYSFFYLLTWLIIWKISKAKKIKMNDKLREYKEKQ